MALRAPRSSLVFFLSSLFAVIAACADDTSPLQGGGGGGGESAQGGAGGTSAQGGAGGSGGAGGWAGLDIEWEPCSADSDENTGDDALCATIPVPLDWNDPNGDTIDFFVKKLPAAMPPARGQLWLLNGGPGYSGADFEGRFIAQSVDIYLPDHRGTGRSSRLACPDAETAGSSSGIAVDQSEIAACVQPLVDTWGDKLSGFTTTQAARDIGEVIRATRGPDDVLFLYGASYGSEWANRYLQLYPTDPTGVIFDGVAIGATLDKIDAWENDLGQRWMGFCGDDALCSSKLGPDPWATMTETLDDFDAGACWQVSQIGYDRHALQELWSFFFYVWDYRPLIAPMVYRLKRCDASDVHFYDHLFAATTGPAANTASERLHSRMLSVHVTLSELWASPPPSLQEILDFRETANVAHFLPTMFATVQPQWPVYPHDEYTGHYAVTDVPVLSLHGDLDFIAQSIADGVADHYAGPHQTHVTVPRSPHGTFGAPQADGSQTCASRLFSAFLHDPTAELDTSCLSGVAPLDFSVPADLSSAFFGTADVWEGDPG